MAQLSKEFENWRKPMRTQFLRQFLDIMFLAQEMLCCVI
jgi:hypothetical protein